MRTVDADTSQLGELAQRLRALDKVGEQIAAEALPHVLEEAKRTAAAGTTADGKAWAPKKKDGGRALVHAADAITGVVSGVSQAVITLILTGAEVFHHRAKGNGKVGTPRRAVLFDPKDGVPAKMREAIETASKSAVARVMRGGR
jgi:hypothetical protein